MAACKPGGDEGISSGKFGAGLDPCAAIQVPFELQDGEEREIIFRLGVGNDINHARGIINRFRGLAAKRDAYESVCHYWKHTLGAVNIETPDASVNMLVNGWLIYQTIGCRIWGRTGYYQSGGAFGFRDQLQDCMALVHCEPMILRDQLLKNASIIAVTGIRLSVAYSLFYDALLHYDPSLCYNHW
jgi:cellobiose phosphorylase